MQGTTPLFPVGQIVATPGALAALETAGHDAREFLRRHVCGDWGDLSEDDRKENDVSVTQSLRILSAYQLTASERLWVITEADRSVTTLLLPSEY